MSLRKTSSYSLRSCSIPKDKEACTEDKTMLLGISKYKGCFLTNTLFTSFSPKQKLLSHFIFFTFFFSCVFFFGIFLFLISLFLSFQSHLNLILTNHSKDVRNNLYPLNKREYLLVKPSWVTFLSYFQGLPNNK